MFKYLSKKVLEYMKDKQNSVRKVYIRINEKGLKISEQGKNHAGLEKNISWAEIENIYVFKRDLFITDQIYMILETVNSELTEIDESIDGWGELIMRLKEHLPEALAFENWFTDVAFPAFETNNMKIYSNNTSKLK